MRPRECVRSYQEVRSGVNAIEEKKSLQFGRTERLFFLCFG